MRELWRRSGLPLMQIVKAIPQCATNSNFSAEKSLSNFTNQEISPKSIGVDVAFEKVLLETKRSLKAGPGFALPG